MNEELKISWLKRLLIVKMLVILFVWALPTWIFPEPVLNFFGIELPEDPIILRLLGSLQIGLVLLYWFAYRNPVRNRDVIRYAVFDNSIALITILGVAFTTGITNPIYWITAV